MRKALFLAALMFCSQIAAAEMLSNPGFEIDKDGNGQPDGWSLGAYQTGAQVSLDQTAAHSGKCALRITGTSDRDRGGATAGFRENQTDARVRYTLSAWVKTEGTTQSKLGTSARITSVDAAGKVLKSDYRLCDPGPYDWRRFEWSVSLPAKTTRFNVALFHHGEGTAWWDDVSLVKTSQPAEAVEASADTPAVAAAPPADAAQVYAQLADFAQRNKMWDGFSLLGEALKSENAGDAAANRTRWAELAFTIPWWKTIFLDNEALFLKDLDLDAPGLEQVKAAAQKKDWPAARTALAEHLKTRRTPNYYNKYTAEWHRPKVAREISAAEKLMTHKYPIHSYKEPVFDLGADINWHVNPIVDREWPTKLHRHSHWQTFMNAYRQTGNEKYAGETIQQMLDWAKDNPIEKWVPATGRFAWSTLNATVRVYGTWFNLLHILRESPQWNGDVAFVFMTEMREHARYLMKNAAKHGNWVIAEAQGLVELGVMLPEFREAKEWRDEGYRRLRRELDIQVLADGVHAERTPGYHSMVMSCFLRPLQLGLLNKIDIPDQELFSSRIEKMYEFYLYGANPAKQMPQVGDAGLMDVSGKMKQGWDMFRREDMLYILSDGKEGKPPVYRSYAFDAAGYFISRGAWLDKQALWSLTDWSGFLGHCHEDMGNICLYAYGSRLLIDAGRFSYDAQLRKYFKETTGHSTVMVDGKSQAHRDPLKHSWVSTDQFDAFYGLTDNCEPLLFERTVVFRQPGAGGAGYWLVADRLTPKPGEKAASHRIDQNWHGLEKLKGNALNSSVVFTPDPEKAKEPLPSLVVANLAQPGLTAAMVEGWVSYQWYQKEPAGVAQFSYENATGPVTFVTVLYPTPAGATPADVKIEALPATLDGAAASPDAVSAVAVTITDGGRTVRDKWIVRHADGGSVEAGGLATNARVAQVRETEGAEPVQWLLAEGNKLTAGGREIFAASDMVQGAGAALTSGTLAFVSTDAKGAQLRAAGRPLTVNGEALKTGAAEGMTDLGTVAAPAVAPAPHGTGPMRIEIEETDEEGGYKTTAYGKPQAKPFAMPEGAVVVEAEAYSNQGNGAVAIADNKVGASGRCFFHWDYNGHWLEWTFDVPSDGAYNLLVRLCSSLPTMGRRLSIDGKVVSIGEGIEFAGTGGYSNNNDDWSVEMVCGMDDQPFSVRLTQGKHVVRLENIDNTSMNVDWLALAPAKP